MKHSVLIAALFALSLSACGEKPAVVTPAPVVVAPVVVEMPATAPATTGAASAPVEAPHEAMDSMKK